MPLKRGEPGELRMRRIYLGLFAAVLAVWLAACQTRSISNSGYQDGGWGRSANPFYNGELSPYDVLGLDPARGASDAEIQAALTVKRPISIKRGDSVMVVQSGAIFPDPEMVRELERYYAVSSFSGVPQRSLNSAPNAAPVPYAQLFRLAAAKGGFDTIIVYWGMLESADRGLGGKAISWLPVVGGVIPDETEHMRIRLMVAVIDTRTGQWESFTTEPIDDEATSSEHARAASDQEQVALLKSKAYHAAAEALIARYGW
jgi:hypothetical protein